MTTATTIKQESTEFRAAGSAFNEFVRAASAASRAALSVYTSPDFSTARRAASAASRAAVALALAAFRAVYAGDIRAGTAFDASSTAFRVAARAARAARAQAIAAESDSTELASLNAAIESFSVSARAANRAAAAFAALA